MQYVEHEITNIALTVWLYSNIKYNTSNNI